MIRIQRVHGHGLGVQCLIGELIFCKPCSRAKKKKRQMLLKKKKSLICCPLHTGQRAPNPWCPKWHPQALSPPARQYCLSLPPQGNSQPPSGCPQCRGLPTLSSQTRALDSPCHQDSQSVTPSQINHLKVDNRSSISGAFQVVLVVKNPPGNARDLGLIPGSGRSPGEGGGSPTTHSSVLAWRIPWTEEPGGLQSMGSQRVRHD